MRTLRPAEWRGDRRSSLLPAIDVTGGHGKKLSGPEVLLLIPIGVSAGRESL